MEYKINSLASSSKQDRISLIFSNCHEELKQRRKLREDFSHWNRDLERLTNSLKSILTGIHSVNFEISHVAEKANAVLDNIQRLFQQLERDMLGYPEELSYLWKEFLPKLTTSCILLRFVQSGDLPDKAEVAAMLGIGSSIEAEVRIVLDVESYFLGILGISDELTRYSIISTGIGHLDRPLRVSEFLYKIYQGFSRIAKTENLHKKMFSSDENDLKKLERIFLRFRFETSGLTSSESSSELSSSNLTTNVDGA